jgi:hypothetical protein
MSKKVFAYPNVSLLSSIKIKGEKKNIVIGGFTIDGGFYLKKPYGLVRETVKSISGEVLVYYNFIKKKNKQCEQERELRRIK